MSMGKMLIDYCTSISLYEYNVYEYEYSSTSTYRNTRILVSYTLYVLRKYCTSINQSIVYMYSVQIRVYQIPIGYNNLGIAHCTTSIKSFWKVFIRVSISLNHFNFPFQFTLITLAAQSVFAFFHLTTLLTIII